MSQYSRQAKQPKRPQQTQQDVTLDIAFKLILVICIIPCFPGVLVGGIGARILKVRASQRYLYLCMMLALLGIAILYFFVKPLTLISLLTDEISKQINTGRSNWPRLFFSVLPLWGDSLFLSPAIAAAWYLFQPRTVDEQALKKIQQEQTRIRQASTAAKRKLRRGRIPDQIDGDGVLGRPIAGDLLAWIARGWFVIKTRELGQHGAVVGGSGSGKTETLLRIAGFVAHVLRWQVVYIDAKGDQPTAARFLAAMSAAGVPRDRMRMFPADPYDGWRGNSDASLNRLIAIEEFTEAYYLASAKNILLLALNAGRERPKSSRELLERLNPDKLLMLYAGDEEAETFIRSTPKKEFAGVINRYRAVFAQLHGQLDGSWAYEDVDAAYILLDGLALRTIASGLGRYFVEDFAHYAGARKPTERKTLFIFDELSAVDADLTNLFERVRSRGVSVFVSAQSIEGLGFKGLMANASRMLSAATTIILHRTSDPEKLLERAGKKVNVETGYSFMDRQTTGAGTARLSEIMRVSPEEVRQLPQGEAFVIAGGRAERVVIAQMVVDAKVEAEYAEEIKRRMYRKEGDDSLALLIRRTEEEEEGEEDTEEDNDSLNVL